MDHPNIQKFKKKKKKKKNKKKKKKKKKLNNILENCFFPFLYK